MDVLYKTKAQFIEWYDNLMKVGNVSEDKLKEEAINFFGEDIKQVNKQTIAKKLKDLKNEHNNETRRIQRIIQKTKKGSGNGFSDPPQDFCLDILNKKERRVAFAAKCRKEIKAHDLYKHWENQCVIFNAKRPEKANDVAGNNTFENESSQIIRITKQRSCGPNIFDAEKVVITNKPDGTVKKNVLKETIATVTTRKRKVSGENESDISWETRNKRTKGVDNILNHVNENDKENKAKMISKIIDDEGNDFAKKVKLSSKTLKENESLTVTETNSLQTGTRSSEFLWRQARTAFKKTLGYSPLASAKKVQKYRGKNMITKKTDWNFEKKNLYKYKQGKNKAKPHETTVLRIKDLYSYIAKVAVSESEDLDLSMNELPVCFDADAGGGRFVATFAFLNRKDSSVVLHPFLVYEGSDCRANLEMTLGEFTEDIREMENKAVLINNENVIIKQFGLFDLAALNTIVGKQNHSATFPCAWTNVSRDHLNSEKHKHKDHTSENCTSIKFLSNKDYETKIAKHAVKTGGKEMAKTGKNFGSIVAYNLMPFENMFRYVPPLMHIIMGETNNVLKELKEATVKIDLEKTNQENKETQQKEAQDMLVQLYLEKENLESTWINISQAEVIMLNDLKRVTLLLEDKEEEASKVANEIFPKSQKKATSKEKCNADLCLIFAGDVKNDFDAKFTCKNTCKIHVRCEGFPLFNYEDTLLSEYTCGKCEKGTSNKTWLEQTLRERHMELVNAKGAISNRITFKKADIDLHENIETECSGPKQRQLKEAMKALGDIARYHGGDLQGKQVQKLLDNARGKAEFKLLDCISEDRTTHDKFKKAIKILADVSDALKMPIEKFDEEDIQMIRHLCEEWGKFWPNEFLHRNITPKGHILSFVLPEIVRELKTFYRFYKVEQKGEEIHAELNDIDRKAWVMKNKEARLWTLIYRYEMRNITKVDIVVPIKRTNKTK